MKANTIKIEEKLLNEILEVKPQDQSLSSFVKATLAKELRRIKVQKAANDYMSYLRSDEEEALSMEFWEKTDLASAPAKKGKGAKR